MGVYSNTEIKSAVASGHIVIDPFVAENVNGSSVDVTLGPWIYRTDVSSSNDIYNPYDEFDVTQYFGDPEKALPNVEVCRRLGRRAALGGIPPDHPVVVLQPHERVLAHTREFIGIKPPGTTSMQARSTTGRNGLAVCFCAGWGDPGYINRWTMELYNLNHRPIVVPVGERVAQIVFHHTGEVEGTYSGLSGKYQPVDSLEELEDAWEQAQMLPRAYKDLPRLPAIEDL